MAHNIRVVGCIFLMMVLAIPACLAQDDEEISNKLFEGWVTEGESFQVSGLDVFVSAGRGGEGIFLFPQKTLMLEENRCGTVDRLKVCMTEWEYLIGGKVKIHGDDKQKFNIYVYVPAPEVTITRSADETSLEVGQSTKVSITLKNEGDQPAVGLKYTETIPSQFELGIVSGLDQGWNRLTWQGAIGKGDEVKFNYHIKAKSPFSESIYGVLEYTVNNVPKKIVDELDINVKSLIGIGQKLDNGKMQYGEENRVYVTVENKRSEDFNAEVYMTMPKSLYVVASHFNNSMGSMYYWKGNIGHGEEHAFITRFRADSAGIQKINVSVRGTFADYKMAEAQEFIDVNVGINDAELYFIPKSIKKGEDSKIKVYLKNPNTYSEFENVDITAASDYFNGTGHLEKYSPNQYNDVLSFDVNVNDTAEFKAKADVIYYINGKRFTAAKEEKIKVTEEKVEEPELPANETNATQTGDRNGAEGPEEGSRGKWTEKELFAVRFVKGIAGRIGDSIAALFEFKDSLQKNS